MLARESILKLLRQLEKEVAEKYKVERMGIFGSFIRGEQEEDSDIDILVEFNEDADLFDFSGLALFLEEKLNHKVDVVPKSAIKQELMSSIMEGVVYL